MIRSAACLSALLGVICYGADAQQSSSQAQEGFYNGKTLRIIVGFPPGGGFDIYARAIAREMGKHIPGAPTIIVQNMPGAASLNSIKYMDVGAPQDGTAINTFNSGVILDSLTNPDKIGLKLTDYHFIGSAARDIPVCYAWHTAGIRNLKDITPDRQFILGNTTRGSSTYINGSILKNFLGVNLRHVLGFPGSAEQRLAIERGEITGDCGSWSSVPVDWLKNARVIPLVKFSTQSVEGLPANIPYVGDLIDEQSKKDLVAFVLASVELGKPYVVSKKVPAARVTILRRAFDQTMTDSDFLAASRKLGIPISPIGGEDAGTIIERIYGAPPQIVQQSLQFLE
jgi:tripartite-type tricarboxylate transporter receptor subunit TctC